MAPHKDDAPLLTEIESIAERLARWVGENPVLVLGGGAAILVLAAAIGGFLAWHRHQENTGSAALAAAELAYREAMGADANALDVPEPANPETARRVRSEGIERYLKVAADHEGTAAATIALLEAGTLRDELGEPEQALTLWQQALAGTRSGTPLRALVLVRLARAREGRAEWSEAAAAYQEAGEVADFAMRYRALADAARCLAEAGEPERAVALYDRVRLEAPTLRLAPHVEARLEELKALPGTPPAGPAPDPGSPAP
jgi:tetratricopeptide (TPR) repeat protein